MTTVPYRTVVVGTIDLFLRALLFCLISQRLTNETSVENNGEKRKEKEFEEFRRRRKVGSLGLGIFELNFLI